MRTNLRFNSAYFTAFILSFISEVLIAIYLKGGFVRHSFGDFLAVILVYCFFRSFIGGTWFHGALAALGLSFVIEFLQLTNILELLHLDDNRMATIILGSTFSIGDLIAYTFGFISILIFETIRHGRT